MQTVQNRGYIVYTMGDNSKSWSAYIMVTSSVISDAIDVIPQYIHRKIVHNAEMADDGDSKSTEHKYRLQSNVRLVRPRT